MPEKRYIDANALLKYLETEIDERNWRLNQFDAGWIYSFIDYAETEDVVSVVRCELCKFIDKSCGDKDVGFCNQNCCIMKDNDFCSYGERKDEK